MLDRQGQGLSTHSLRNPFKQHAENIDDDAADLIRFVRAVVPHDAPIILQGNSAGGLLSLLAMHEAREEFAGAVLTTPLLGMAKSRREDAGKPVRAPAYAALAAGTLCRCTKTTGTRATAPNTN